jgi:hypothetical protein
MYFNAFSRKILTFSHRSLHWPSLPESITFGDYGRCEVTLNDRGIPLICSIFSQLWMFKSYLGRDSALAGEEVRRLLNKVQNGFRAFTVLNYL